LNARVASQLADFLRGRGIVVDRHSVLVGLDSFLNKEEVNGIPPCVAERACGRNLGFGGRAVQEERDREEYWQDRCG